MRISLDIPRWLARILKSELERRIRHAHEQALTRADLPRVEKHRQDLALAVGQIDAQLLEESRRYEESIIQSYLEAAPNGGEA